MNRLNMAIRWSDDPAKISAVRRSQGASLHARPRHIAPGSSIAIVQKNGTIRYIFECEGVDGPTSVTLADGSRRNNGFIVRAKAKSIHSPQASEPDILKTKWYATGQFRYFDRHWKPTFVTDHFRDGKYQEDQRTPRQRFPIRPYTGGIPGLERTAPEAVLVDEYVRWMSTPQRWGHRYIPTERLFCRFV
jgi:hypothetical protein